MISKHFSFENLKLYGKCRVPGQFDNRVICQYHMHTKYSLKFIYMQILEWHDNYFVQKDYCMNVVPSHEVVPLSQGWF